MDWQPLTVALKHELMRELPLVVSTWQERLFADLSPPIDQWPEEKRAFVLEQFNQRLDLHRLMVSKYKETNRMPE
jgi:hypothetical protein